MCASWKAGYVKNQKYEAISEGFVVEKAGPSLYSAATARTR
jgi:hypothetical protein